MKINEITLKDIKNSLLMPKTEFEMRGNLVQKDLKYIKFWNDIKLYDNVSNRKEKEFFLHDGPPYANGDIHLGHSLNKILKDFIVKDKILNGNKINFIPGWDTHGLPIELQVQKQGVKLSEVGKEEYLKACFKYAYKQVEKQEKQFKKLGVIADFDNKYLTLKKEFEASEVEVFFEMLNKNLVYRDLKPVYWSWSSKTALADAEVEYKDAEDYSIYVKFKLENNLSVLIWTTTPWTLPANVALSFGKDIKYIIVKDENTKEEYIIANDLLDSINSKENVKLTKIKDIDINEFIGKDATNPINGNKSKLVWGHHVTTEGGTGVVHTAGGHGLDDYIIVKDNNLDLIVVMDDEGHTINSGKYDGNFYQKTNKLVIDDLTKDNTLLFVEKFVHSVPIDWRTKEPIIYRATKQWFFSVNSIKDKLIDSISEVKWNPSWGEERLKKMTQNRDDWCISRQRIWGVPIPIIYDGNGEPIVNKELQKNIINLFNEKGMLGWHSTSIEELLPKEIKFDKKMTKEFDTLDVWFDSGTSHNFILKDKIADIYLEGNDQYRGWFNSSLITSYVMKGRAPYKEVITHGFVTDGNGNKMSKSQGNGISPIEIIDKFGLDILRMWVASSDYINNVRISDDILTQITNDYRKIRNTLRFILGNISDYNNDFKGEFNLIEKGILSNISKNFVEIRKNFDNHIYHQNLKLIMNEISTGSISYYLEYVKDIVYIEKEDSSKRRETQFVLTEILKFILYSFAPIIPVTIEEAFHSWNSNKEDKSIFESTYPKFDFEANDIWNTFNEIRSEVNKELEKLRNDKKIKRSYEAQIALSISEKEFSIFENENLKDLFFVGKVELSKGDLKVKATNFDGIKCDRCWKLFDKNEITNINSVENISLCPKCVKHFEK